MITDFVDILFGCWHSNYSFPMTDKLRSNRASQATGTYVVCLDCGKEFPYDWKQMKVVEAHRNHQQPEAPEFSPEPVLIRKQAA